MTPLARAFSAIDAVARQARSHPSNVVKQHLALFTHSFAPHASRFRSESARDRRRGAARAPTAAHRDARDAPVAALDRARRSRRVERAQIHPQTRPRAARGVRARQFAALERARGRFAHRPRATRIAPADDATRRDRRNRRRRGAISDN